MIKFLFWLLSKLQPSGYSVTGPVYIADVTLKVPAIYHGPLDEVAAKEYCPSSNNRTPAIIRYSPQGPVVLFEWNETYGAWMKPRSLK